MRNVIISLFNRYSNCLMIFFNRIILNYIAAHLTTCHTLDPAKYLNNHVNTARVGITFIEHAPVTCNRCALLQPCPPFTCVDQSVPSGHLTNYSLPSAPVSVVRAGLAAAVWCCNFSSPDSAMEQRRLEPSVYGGVVFLGCDTKEAAGLLFNKYGDCFITWVWNSLLDT